MQPSEDQTCVRFYAGILKLTSNLHYLLILAKVGVDAKNYFSQMSCESTAEDCTCKKNTKKNCSGAHFQMLNEYWNATMLLFGTDPNDSILVHKTPRQY